MKIENDLASRYALTPTPLQTFRDAEPDNDQDNKVKAGSVWAWQQQAGALPPEMGTKVNLFA